MILDSLSIIENSARFCGHNAAMRSDCLGSLSSLGATLMTNRWIQALFPLAMACFRASKLLEKFREDCKMDLDTAPLPEFGVALRLKNLAYVLMAHAVREDVVKN